MQIMFNSTFPGENWSGVSLDDFADCSSNLAANRQTRMLADLALVGCYNKSAMPPVERDRVMLASAKRNLAAMSYFGLTEYQKVSSPPLVFVLLLYTEARLSCITNRHNSLQYLVVFMVLLCCHQLTTIVVDLPLFELPADCSRCYFAAYNQLWYTTTSS